MPTRVFWFEPTVGRDVHVASNMISRRVTTVPTSRERALFASSSRSAVVRGVLSPSLTL
jgi:hypothetical protein